MKLPLRATGNHCLRNATTVRDPYEDYHVVDSNDRIHVEMSAKTDAEYIVKACNLYPELVEALDGLLKDIGGGKKKCGHDFACICAGDKAKEVLKKAKEDI